MWSVALGIEVRPLYLAQLAEMDIIEAIEKLTDPLRKEGQWISRIDLQEQGSKLVLVDMGKVRYKA